MDEHEEIRLGDLVTYIPVSAALRSDPISQRYTQEPEDTRQLWMVIKINRSSGIFTLMRYDSVEDIKGWSNKDCKIQDAWSIAVRKELFQTQLMNAELHYWFLENKGVASAR